MERECGIAAWWNRERGGGGERGLREQDRIGEEGGSGGKGGGKDARERGDM